MAVLDAVTLPLTRLFNVRGDRIVMVGKRRAGDLPGIPSDHPE